MSKVRRLRNAPWKSPPPPSPRPLESVIIKELIPHVDQTYRTLAKRETRSVEGFSMGGFGAFHYLLVHPEMFAGVSSLSGVFDITPAPTVFLGPRPLLPVMSMS